MSSGTVCPAAGSVPITWPAGSVLSTGTVRIFGKPEALRICWATSTVWPDTSGTAAVCGPVPTTMVISLVIAEVWLAGGTVDEHLVLLLRRGRARRSA